MTRLAQSVFLACFTRLSCAKGNDRRTRNAEHRFMNDEPLRPIEQEWLDRNFIRERMSKSALGIASLVTGSIEETGLHVEGCIVPAPCRAIDKVASR